MSKSMGGWFGVVVLGVGIGAAGLCERAGADPNTESKCFSSWIRGTLVLISTDQNGNPSLLFRAPGTGTDADDCLTNPGPCLEFPCDQSATTTNGTSYTCIDAPIGSCFLYRVEACSISPPTPFTPATIKEIYMVSRAECP